MTEAVGRETPLQVEFTNGVVTAVADAPAAKGGGGAGFGPHELLEAALATCMAITARTFADEHRLPLRRAAVRVALDRSDPAAAAFDCRLDLDGDLTPADRERVRAAVVACPVARTLARRVSVRAV